jgi:hypothetical protein
VFPALLHRLRAEWIDAIHGAGMALEPPLSAIMVGDASAGAPLPLPFTSPLPSVGDFALRVGVGDFAGQALKDQGLAATFLIFGAGQSQPGVVLKSAHTPDRQTYLAREQQILTELWAVSALSGTLPRPLGCFQAEASTVTLHTWLRGTSLRVLLQRRERTSVGQIRHDLFRAQVWIQLLQTATALGAVQFPGRPAIEQRVELLHRMAGDRVDLPQRFVDSLIAEAEEFRELRLPLVGRHGEFGPRSIVVTTNQVGVINWGSFTRGPLPLDDIFSFAVEMAQLHVRGRSHWVQVDCACYEAFIENNWFSQLIAECVNRYLRAMHLPEEIAYLFFSLFLLDTAALELQRGVARASWLQFLNHYASHERRSIFHPKERRMVALSG